MNTMKTHRNLSIWKSPYMSIHGTKIGMDSAVKSYGRGAQWSFQIVKSNSLVEISIVHSYLHTWTFFILHLSSFTSKFRICIGSSRTQVSSTRLLMVIDIIFNWSQSLFLSYRISFRCFRCLFLRFVHQKNTTRRSTRFCHQMKWFFVTVSEVNTQQLESRCASCVSFSLFLWLYTSTVGIE